jgi:hypothetical protein
MRGVLFQPTDEQRRLVKALAGFGVTHDDIAVQVGCEPKTLRKHFRDELDRGSVEATAKVAQSLFQMATTGKNVAAAIFWMKARAGWREKHEVQVSMDPLKQMSDAELDAEIGRLERQLGEFRQFGSGPDALVTVIDADGTREVA